MAVFPAAEHNCAVLFVDSPDCKLAVVEPRRRTPMSDTWPSKAMNPIAALTDSGMPAMSRAKRPPVSANGMVAMMASALRPLPIAA